MQLARASSISRDSVEIGRIICILSGVALTYDHFSLLCRMLLCVRDRFVCAFVRRPYIPQTQSLGGDSKVKQSELGLLRGFLLCLCDSQAVRLKSSRWKRSLLVFSSGVCLEIAATPFLVGYWTSWQSWLLASLFVPLGLIGLYASKFGDDRFVESLLVVPKLDLRV